MALLVWLALAAPVAALITGVWIVRQYADNLPRTPDLERWEAAVPRTSVIVAAENPPALELPYEALVGAGAAVRTDRMVAVRAGEETVLFVTPDDLDTLFPDIEHPARPTPYVAGLRFRVHNTEAAAAYFKAAGIDHARSLDGTVLVPATAADGIFLEFSSRA